MEAGAFALTGVASLPNVSVAFPGEHWSDGVAQEAIVPGSAIVPGGTNDAGRIEWRVAEAADAGNRVSIALRTVQPPDPTGVLGPNEVMNQTIQPGEYVHAYKSGAFHLTLVVPGTSYDAGDLIGWDVDGVRPAGKAAGTGAWALDSAADVDGIFEVIYPGYRAYGEDDEGVLTVKRLGFSQS